jgi:hypothetical protein
MVSTMAPMTLYTLSDVLAVPLTTGQITKSKWEVKVEGFEFPMHVEAAVVHCTDKMSAAIAHLRGDLWGYFVCIEKPDGTLRTVMILFSGVGESFGTLTKKNITETYAGIKPKKVAHYELNKTGQWEPHGD